MKNIEATRSSIPRRSAPRAEGASESTIRSTAGDERISNQPEPVDPRGPEETMWPRGVFNFANIVVAGCVILIILLVVMGILALNASPE